MNNVGISNDGVVTNSFLVNNIRMNSDSCE